MSQQQETHSNLPHIADALRTLREDAEKHLEQAEKALFDDNVSDEEALSHLDAALECVREMFPEDRKKLNSDAA